ncbi:MAG: DUF192 domain-containing protein [Alphaproteobacteria bacterium]|nr:DUF192 domain-containing protein [Alphaproteobacteria bacterium]
MSTLRKWKILGGALLVAALGIISYCGNSCFNVFSYDALAQTDANNENNDVIKIPPPIKTSDTHQQVPLQKLQTSDIKILTSEKKTLIFRVELAHTEDQKRMGLMFRNVIMPGTGMLFLFDDVKERTFWMKNTWTPLDIIFIREDGVIHNIHYNAEPNSLERISSEGEVQHVLEICGGEAKRQGISIGDRIMLD